MLAKWPAPKACINANTPLSRTEEIPWTGGRAILGSGCKACLAGNVVQIGAVQQHSEGDDDSIAQPQVCAWDYRGGTCGGAILQVGQVVRAQRAEP